MSYELSKMVHRLCGDPAEVEDCPACIKAAREEQKERGMSWKRLDEGGHIHKPAGLGKLGGEPIWDVSDCPVCAGAAWRPMNKEETAKWDEIREKMRELASRTVEKYEKAAKEELMKHEALRWNAHLEHVFDSRPNPDCRFCKPYYDVVIMGLNGPGETFTIYRFDDSGKTPIYLTEEERAAIANVVKRKITKMRKKAAR